MLPWIVLALVALLQTLLVGAVLVPLARKYAVPLGLMDAPTLERKIHTAPIPRAGGAAIFPAFWGCFWLNVALGVWLVPQLGFLPPPVQALAGNIGLKLPQTAGLFVGCLTIFVLGLLDDRFDLPPKVRLVVQILACVPLLATGTVLKLFLPPILAYPLTVCWLVLLTNSFNFLDNMNGLTSGVSFLICAIMATISILSREWYMLLIFSMIAGAVLAFWFFNFPKASIFLGDAGSTHLGFCIGSLMILTTYFQEGVPSRMPILIPLIVLGIPLFDTASVMWIRWKAGKPFMVGDTNHLSHRLVALGMSRTEAVLFIYAMVAVLGLAALPLRTMQAREGIFQAVAILLIFLLLHWLERVSYRRSKSADSC